MTNNGKPVLKKNQATSGKEQKRANGEEKN